MNQEHYNAVREAVIKAVPEISEWRCENCQRKFGEYVNGCVFCWRDELSREENLKLFPSRSVRLKDRPIRFADVLLALGLENFHNNDDIPELIYGYRHSWDLRQDDLSLQSPKTIEFLYELLK